MSPRLEEAFERGALVRPTKQRTSLVDLVRAIAVLGGVPDVEVSPPTRQCIDLIGAAEHLVFVLVDGLGMNTIRRLPGDSFLRQSLKAELIASCPSTTACALTCVATAQYPTRHAVAGWFTHLPDRGFTMTTLPFVERFSGRPLAERGIQPVDVLPMPPILPRMTRRALSLTPTYISNTAYNLYSRGGTEGRGYKNLPDAVEQIVDFITEEATGPTYTHLYLDDVDTLCHHVGVTHADVLPLVMHVDAQLRRLAVALGGQARIVISADHGLIDVPADDQTLLLAGDPLLELLAVPPTGDARMPVFHLRPRQQEPFVEQFEARFGGKMVLIETDKADHQRLFGPEPLLAIARPRFGDFIAIPILPATLAYHPPSKPRGHVFPAVHAGLSPEEMNVPLCVA